MDYLMIFSASALATSLFDHTLCNVMAVDLFGPQTHQPHTDTHSMGDAQVCSGEAKQRLRGKEILQNLVKN